MLLDGRTDFHTFDVAHLHDHGALQGQVFRTVGKS